MKKTLIIDSDYGLDDAFVFTMAKKLVNYELKLITSVSGISKNYIAAQQINKLINFLNLKSVNIALGENSLQIDKDVQKWQKNLISPLNHEKFNDRILKSNAVEAINELLLTNNNIEILCLGPLTNIATLLEKYPENSVKINKLVIMGTSITGKKEFNQYFDQKSYDIVKKYNINTQVIPFEVGKEVKISFEELQNLALNNKKTEVLFEMYKTTGHFANQKPAFLFDVAAFLCLENELLFKFEDIGKNISICKDADYKTLNSLVKDYLK